MKGENMTERIAVAVERIALCLEKIVEMQAKQVKEAESAPQKMAEMTEQLKKTLGGMMNYGK